MMLTVTLLLLLLFQWLIVSTALAWAPVPTRVRTRTFALSSASAVNPQQHLEKDDDVAAVVEHNILHTCPVLGDIYRINMGEDDDDFLAANAVPTFAVVPQSAGSKKQAAATTTTKARGLEGAIRQGPAFCLDNLLSKDNCEDLIETFETHLQFGNYRAGKNFHGALQIVVPPEVTQPLAQVLSRHVNLEEVQARRTEMMRATGNEDDAETHDVRMTFCGLNRRWRVYRYAPGGEETFAPHIDAGFPPSGLTNDGTNLIWDDSASYLEESNDNGGTTTEIVSRLTLLMYLNDDFVGGETKFYQPNSAASSASSDSAASSVIAAVQPIAGSCLVFPQGVGEQAVDYARQHWPLHEGSPVVSAGSHRPKYVIRSDLLFCTTKEPLLLDNPLWCNDHHVRNAFLPNSSNGSLLDAIFTSHTASLYNPHMGVENIATLLYSLIRFTKKRRIVEIGAGYTSLYILQALKDNHDELTRIRQLERAGQCTLLDIDWTVSPPQDENKDNDDEQPLLLCIDNCEHQKETATGACAVAKALGLDGYLQFLKGDAFDMKEILGEQTGSIDILWCDFGVGSRMKEFLSEGGAWASLKPGGFLLCHSTLTNQRTRDWLEAVRARQGEDITGMPPDEYVELSLLEPHKRYQNSVSIFQKRKNGDDTVYSEPIFSEYA